MGRKRDLTRDILVESLSEDHVNIIEDLKEPRYDDDIADNLKVKATIVRTLLNDLHAANLVEYERFKNKRTGWYTYLWNRREDKITEHVRSFLSEKLDSLNSSLESEKQSVLFNCKCSKLPFEEALGLDFACPECNKSLVEYDNSEEIDRIVTEIAEINSLLEQT